MIRGYLYFEDETIENIKEYFSNINTEENKIGFFESSLEEKKEVTMPGIFISGSYGEDLSGEQAAMELRRKANDQDVLKNCDVSSENDEDIIKIIKESNKEKYEGHYLCIKIKPDYEIDEVYQLAKKLGELTDSYEYSIRTAEQENPDDKDPVICIELFTNAKVENHIIDNIRNLLDTEQYEAKDFVFIEFI